MANNGDDPVLYVVALTPQAGYEDKFHHWYNTEHVPELIACPGFLAGRRYEMAQGIDGSPRYLAVYDMAGMWAFDTPEYRALSARTLEDRTPLAREVLTHRSRDINAKYREIFRMTGEHH